MNKPLSASCASFLCSCEISKLFPKHYSENDKTQRYEDLKNLKKNEYLNSISINPTKFSLKNIKKKLDGQGSSILTKTLNLSKQQPVVFNSNINCNQSQSLNEILDILSVQHQKNQYPLSQFNINHSGQLKLNNKQSDKIHSPSQFKSHYQQIVSGKSSQAQAVQRNRIKQVQIKPQTISINIISKTSLKKNQNIQNSTNELTLDRINNLNTIYFNKYRLPNHQDNLISNDSDYIAHIPEIGIFKNNLNERLEKTSSPFNNIKTTNTIQSQNTIQSKISFLKKQNQKMSHISTNLLQLEQKKLFDSIYRNMINVKPAQSVYQYRNLIGQNQKPIQNKKNNLRLDGCPHQTVFSRGNTSQNQSVVISDNLKDLRKNIDLKIISAYLGL